jgi:sigma-E factor negative regulatory protein RseA
MDDLRTDSSECRDPTWRALSALVDGELPPSGDADLARACQAWRDDAQTRATWHAYAMIGDVLRSEDLATEPAHDRDFLRRLRERLADEPVVLAPLAAPGEAADDGAAQWAVGAGKATPMRTMNSAAPVGMARHSARRWGAPAAMAAGVLAVVGVAGMMRGAMESSGTAATLAATTQAPEVGRPSWATASAASAAPFDAAPVLASEDVELRSSLIRSAEIDRYLNAHRQYALGPVLAAPGSLRQVAATPPAGR